MRNLFLFIMYFLFASAYSQSNDDPILLVRLEVSTPDCIVSVDGKQVFPEKGLIELETGKHFVEISKQGFDKINEEIKISRKNTVFTFHLNPTPGSPVPNEVSAVKKEVNTFVFVRTFPGIVLNINGIVYPSQHWIESKNENLDILLSHESYDTLRERIYIDDGDSLIVELYPKRSIDFKNFDFNMVLIPAGKFHVDLYRSNFIGSDTLIYPDSFYFSRHEVTQSLWIKIMGTNPSKTVGDNFPVENISWQDVQVFITKLNEATSRSFRLPTEAEWVYAASGGDKSNHFKYAGGNNLDSLGWYWRNSGDSLLTGRLDHEQLKLNNCRIHPVGQLAPNELGIFDMSGNVWEWVSDWYSVDNSAISPKNPTGAASGDTKVCKGGSFMSKPEQCAVKYIFSYPPSGSFIYLGFRLAENL